MNLTPDNPLRSGAAPASGSSDDVIDQTLRLIARVPIPEGLEERVHASLLRAPARHKVLAWPVFAGRSALWAGSGWARAAAAAAIVFVVAGGGWGVYRRAQHPAAKVLLMPAPQPVAGEGFSSAGAKRTPQTVNGPVVQPATPVAKHAGKKARRHRASVKPRAGSPSVKAAAKSKPASAAPVVAPAVAAAAGK